MDCFDRIHEIRARDRDTFDPTTCLLASDIKVDSMMDQGKQVKLLRIHLKNPKEQKLAQGVTIELFETGTFLCPVEAYHKWRKVSKLTLSKAKPAMRLDRGQAYTGRDFNVDLKSLLSPHMDYSKGTITSHSFRAGLATLMAQLGYSGGAWSSVQIPEA